MSVLEISNLSGGYSEVNILNGVTVSVGTGEIVTVAGTNGAGKSTLAKAVVGLLPRVEGEIRFEGSVINAVPTEMRANRGIGYVPQSRTSSRRLRFRKIWRSWWALPTHDSGSRSFSPYSRRWQRGGARGPVRCRAASASSSPMPAR